MTGGERGSATVWMVGLIALVFVAAGMAVTLAKVVSASHRADAAADLAALSAASVLHPGIPGGVVVGGGRGVVPLLGTDACQTGEQIARAHGAVLDVCRVDPAGVVDLEVVVTVALPIVGRDLDLHGRARAGPSAKANW